MINGIGTSADTAGTNVAWTSSTYNVSSKTTTRFTFNVSSNGMPNNCNWITIGYVN